jgi:hypothetical protein
MHFVSAHLLILDDGHGIELLMNQSVRHLNRKHMTRFGRAVEGVAR